MLLARSTAIARWNIDGLGDCIFQASVAFLIRGVECAVGAP
jgi:hypothetical protein